MGSTLQIVHIGVCRRVIESSKNQAYNLVGRLVREGYLARVKGEARSIRLPAVGARPLAHRITDELFRRFQLAGISRAAVFRTVAYVIDLEPSKTGGGRPSAGH